MADTARTSAPQPAAGRALRVLAMAVTLAGNLVPLYGVLFWRWDTFQLLMLYWMETVIIAFWTIRRLANLPDSELGTITINDEERAATRAGLAGFFTLHAGMFIMVHLIFLCALFSGDWFRTHGVRSFLSDLFVSNGAWLALVFMFAAAWISFRGEAMPTLTQPIEDRLARTRFVARAKKKKGDGVGPVVGRLYVRIFIMQIAIIAGAWFAQGFGSMAPLLLVIGFKTLFDLAEGFYGPLGKQMAFSSANTSVKG